MSQNELVVQDATSVEHVDCVVLDLEQTEDDISGLRMMSNFTTSESVERYTTRASVMDDGGSVDFGGGVSRPVTPPPTKAWDDNAMESSKVIVAGDVVSHFSDPVMLLEATTGDATPYTSADLGLSPFPAHSFAIDGRPRPKEECASLRAMAPPGVPEGYVPFKVDESPNFEAYCHTQDVKEDAEYPLLIHGLLQKLEGFRARLQACLDEAEPDFRTLHPLLQGKVIVHFVEKQLPFTQQQAAAKDALPVPRWCYGQPRNSNGSELPTIAVGSKSKAPTCIAVLGCTLREIEVALCALAIGRCAADSIACTMSFIPIGFRNLLISSSQLSDAMDLIKLQDKRTVDEMLRGDVSTASATNCTLSPLGYKALGFTMVCFMTSRYGLNRFLRFASCRVSAQPYHMTGAAVNGTKAVPGLALAALDEGARVHLQERFDLVEGCFLATLEAAYPETAQEVKALKMKEIQTRRDLMEERSQKQKADLEQQDEPPFPAILWPLRYVPSQRTEVTEWLVIKYVVLWFWSERKRDFLECTGSAVIVAFVAVTQPLLVDAIFSDALPSGDYFLASTWLVLLAAGGVLGAHFKLLTNTANVSGSIYLCGVQAAMCKHLSGLPQEYLEILGERNQEDIIENVLKDIDKSFLSLANLFCAVLTALALIGTLFSMSPMLVVPLVLLIPVYGYYSQHGANKIEAMVNVCQRERLVFYIKLKENIKQASTKRVLGLWRFLDDIIDETTRDMITKLDDTALLQEQHMRGLNVISNLKGVVILAGGVLVYSMTNLNLGTLLAFYIAGSGLDDLAAVTVASYLHFVGCKEMMWRLLQIVNIPANRSVRAHTLPVSYDVSVKNLDFERQVFMTEPEVGPEDSSVVPETTRLILSNVSLEVQEGMKVGLIGKSGCGKSTFLRLLARVYEPTRGTITIGGVSLEEVSFSRTVAVMDQEPLLFDGSLGFNISIGRESSDIQGIKHALHMAGYTDDLERLPAGLDTLLGEGSGLTLSGGQKQRVAMARTFFRRCPIVLLDEPSSAQEPEFVRVLGQTLLQLTYRHHDGSERPTTIFSITHNLDMLQGWSMLAMFVDGTIAEHGNHKALRAKRGHYHRMMARMESLITGPDGQPTITPRRLMDMWMFAFVEEHSLVDLPAKFQPVTIADGAYLVKEGDACDRLVLLVRGQLHEMKSGVEGSKRWEMGDSAGEDGLVADLTNSDLDDHWALTLKAKGPCTVLELSRRSFQRVLDSNIMLKDAVERAVDLIEEARSLKSLHAIWPFAFLTRDQVKQVCGYLSIDMVGGNTSLFTMPADPCRALYIIVKGQVQLVSDEAGPSEAPRHVVKTLGPGAFFGDWHFNGVEAPPTKTLVSARTAAGVEQNLMLVLRHETMLKLQKKNDPIAKKIALAMSTVRLARSGAQLGHSCWVLAGLHENVLDCLGEVTYQQVYSEDMPLIEEDGPDQEKCFIVLTGHVTVMKQLDGHDLRSLHEVKAGGCINPEGLMAGTTFKTRTIAAIADELTMVLVVTRTMLREAMERCKADNDVLNELCTRLNQIQQNDKILDLMGQEYNEMISNMLAGMKEHILRNSEEMTPTTLGIQAQKSRASVVNRMRKTDSTKDTQAATQSDAQASMDAQHPAPPKVVRTVRRFSLTDVFLGPSDPTPGPAKPGQIAPAPGPDAGPVAAPVAGGGKRDGGGATARRVFTLLSGAITGTLPGTGGRVKLAAGDSFWFASAFEKGKSKPKRGHALESARASRGKVVVASLPCDAAELKDRFFSGHMRLTDMSANERVCGLFDNEAHFQERKTYSGKVVKAMEELKSVQREVKGLEVRLGWAAPFNARRAFLRACKQMRVLRAMGMDPTAAGSAANSSKGGGLKDELDAAQSRLKRVKREVESRTQMLRKQLLRWRQLGFVRNKWQTMAAAYREHRGARKGRRVATTTATKVLRSPKDKNLWDQEEVDPDDVFDLSLGRLKLVESKLNALISRRLERLGRFRTTVRTVWDLLSEPAEKTVKMEAEWSELESRGPTHVPTAVSMVISEVMRLEPGIQLLLAESKAELARLSDVLGLPMHVRNKVLIEDFKNTQHPLAPSSPPVPQPDPEPGADGAAASDAAAAKVAQVGESLEPEEPSSYDDVQNQLEQLLSVRADIDRLQLALPFLEAKAKEVEDRDDLLYSAHQLVVHQCQSVLNLITTPSVDDAPPMPAPMVKPRAKKSATSIASTTAGPGHDFMHLSVDELGRSLSGGVNGASSTVETLALIHQDAHHRPQHTANSIQQMRASLSAASAQIDGMAEEDPKAALTTILPVVSNLQAIVHRRVVAQHMDAVERERERSAKQAMEAAMQLDDSDVVDPEFVLSSLPFKNACPQLASRLDTCQQLWGPTGLHASERVDFVRRLIRIDTAMDYNSMLAEVDTLTADLRIKLNHDKEISRCSSVYSQVVNDLCDETAERIKALTQELGQAASIELIQASDIPVPEPTSGVNTSSLDYIKFQNADRIVVLRAEHAVLKKEALKRRKERNAIISQVDKSLKAMSDLNAPDLEEESKLAKHLAGRCTPLLSVDVISELRDEARILQMRLDEFRRSEHAAQVDRGTQLLESLQVDPKVMKQFLANHQLPGDLPSEEIAYALSSIRIKVTELTSRSMLATFGHATVRCQKVWDKMQVSQERVSNCFRALGNSIESACAHMETEMGRLVRMQEKATKKQTDLLEKCEEAWSHLVVPDDARNRFKSAFGTDISPTALEELQRYTDILTNSIQMGRLKAELIAHKDKIALIKRLPTLSIEMKKSSAARIKEVKQAKKYTSDQIAELKFNSMEELKALESSPTLLNLLGEIPTKKNLKMKLGITLPHHAPLLHIPNNDPMSSLARRVFPT